MGAYKAFSAGMQPFLNSCVGKLSTTRRGTPVGTLSSNWCGFFFEIERLMI